MNSQTNASENNAANNHISANAANGSKTGENSDEESDAESSSSKREIEIQSVEKLPEIVTDDVVGSSRELKTQNDHFGGVNTKAHALKGTDDAPSGNVCDINKLQVFSPENNVGTKVFLKSWKNVNKDVENEFWMVHVDLAITKCEELIRSYKGYKIIGHAIGADIAWPSTYFDKING